MHKSTLAVPKYSPQILVTFKIKNLTRCNCVKDWDWEKGAPRQDWDRKAPGRVRVGDAINLSEKVYLGTKYTDCHDVKVLNQESLK